MVEVSMEKDFNPRPLSQDVISWYQKLVDPAIPNSQNVHLNLRNPLLHATCKILHSQTQSTYEQDWGKWDESLYDKLGRYHKARMNAFLQGCALAIPSDPSSHLALKPKLEQNQPQPTQPLKSPRAHMLTSIQSAAMMRTSTQKHYPQIRPSELAIRLGLYFLGMTRKDCTEPPKATKARANCLVRDFVATVGCVTSVGPTLTQLLEVATKEILCVEYLSAGVMKMIRGVILEYEHQVSFASLAFLSSPEDSAEQRLAPMVFSYLQYIQQNKEGIFHDCEMENILRTSLNPNMRHMFHTIVFRSIGHLLEVCHNFRFELQNIEIPPRENPNCLENVKSPCDDNLILKQAIRDLQREVLTVNGHVLPPVRSRKELVEILTQTLNSRSLFRRKNRYDRLIAAAPHISDSEGLFSSGNEGDVSDGARFKPEHPLSQPSSKMKPRNPRQKFQLSTIDVMTRRLLVTSSRTGMGGDAYFIVRDLFGGDDVEVVPTRELSTSSQGIARKGSIEIVVRLSSVTIKCHASFDVYPKSSVGDSEPLIQLHTTTAETIGLQEVRASDSDDQAVRIKSQSNREDDQDSSDDEDVCSKLILKEKRTDKTGWKTISIRPALYVAVGDWNTPS